MSTEYRHYGSDYQEEELTADCPQCAESDFVILVDVVIQQDEDSGTLPVWYCKKCKETFSKRSNMSESALLSMGINYQDSGRPIDIENSTIDVNGNFNYQLQNWFDNHYRNNYPDIRNDMDTLKDEIEGLRQELVETKRELKDPLDQIKKKLEEFNLE